MCRDVSVHVCVCSYVSVHVHVQISVCVDLCGMCFSVSICIWGHVCAAM